jgi:acetyltransferase-like isoleucine patch superfamily enzyme
MKRYIFLLHPLKFLYVQSALIMDFARKGRALLRQARFADTVKGTLGEVRIIGNNLYMGEHSYINSGHIATDAEAAVKIGRWCAIGHNVTILAVTHDVRLATGPGDLRPTKKGDVIIEDGVWIGSNAIITPGVRIGEMSVIGGNSVVTKDIPPYTVCAGIPCRLLFKKEEEEIEQHKKLIEK